MKGITLLEVLTLGFILLILGMIVVPEFTHASIDLKKVTFESNYADLQDAVAKFKKDHDGVINSKYPLEAQLILPTNAAGEPISPGCDESDYSFGPYIKEIPSNPYQTSVYSKMIAISGEKDEHLNGWVFEPKTGEISPAARP